MRSWRNRRLSGSVGGVPWSATDETRSPDGVRAVVDRHHVGIAAHHPQVVDLLIGDRVGDDTPLREVPPPWSAPLDRERSDRTRREREHEEDLVRPPRVAVQPHEYHSGGGRPDAGPPKPAHAVPVGATAVHHAGSSGCPAAPGVLRCFANVRSSLESHRPDPPGRPSDPGTACSADSRHCQEIVSPLCRLGVSVAPCGTFS